MNVAIFSPHQNAYSETFIRAHKNYLKDNVYLYYGRKPYINLDGKEKQFNFLKFFLRIGIKIGILDRDSLWIVPIKKSLKHHKIDRILIEYGQHSNHLLPLLEKINAHVVTIFHGFDASVYEVIEECKNYHDVFRLSNRIIAVSLEMKNDLIALGCDPSKLIYTPCAPDDTFFDIQPTFSQKQFISIGRFVDKKAPYLSILAFQIVLNKYPAYILKMGGDGPLLNTCKNLVEYMGIQKSVFFLGIISPKEFKKELSTSIGFIQHSITADNGNKEGTPVGVLEASAAGIPVISTYHAGIKDVVIDNQTGLLSHEKDVQNMAHNIIKIIENRELALKMGLRGRTFVKDNYNMNKHIRIIQKALEPEVS